MNNDLVIMERQNIVDIADALRNKTGVNDEMTLADMVTSINEIDTSGPELPSAEQDGVFGLATQNEEYGIVINDTGKLNYYAYPGDFDIVVRYRAKEAFSLLGARAYLRSNNYSTKFTISINGELKATFNIPYQQGVKVWTNRYFDQQYNIAVGDVIEIRQTGVSYPTYIPLSATTINGKVEVTYSKGGSGGENPTLVHGVYDIIMAPVQAELPDKYQIERATMDDMAVEVQRISGINTKLTLSQIQSNLESVKLQEKSVTPTAETQTITPDSNYYGLSKVTVNPALLQEKTVTPTTEQQEIVPDTGYYGLSKIIVEAAVTSEGLPSAEEGVF